MLQLKNIPAAAHVKKLLQRVRPKPKPPADALPAGSFYRPYRDCQVRGLDAIYDAAFGHRKHGVFVEIGAYDGQAFSNTCFLADLGWRGVYVEPIPEFAAACTERHRRNPAVAVVNAAIGNAAGATELHVAGVLTTGNHSTYAAYQNIAWTKGAMSGRKVTAPVMTLDSLLEDCKIAAGFDLLVVDVEGGEPDVFAGFELARWRPRMLIVELCDAHPDFMEIESVRAPAAQVRELILNAGYTEVYIDAINTVFRCNRT